MQGRDRSCETSLWSRIEQDRIGRQLAQYLPYLERFAADISSRLSTARQQIDSYRTRRTRAGMNGAVLVVLVLAAAIKILAPSSATPAPAFASDNEYHSPVTLAASPKRKPATKPAAEITSATPAPIPTSIETTAKAALKRPKPAPEAPTQAQALKQEYADARDNCLKQLVASAEYQTTKSNADRLESRVRALRQYDPGRELPKTSVEWMNAKSDLSHLQQAALLADPQVKRLEDQLRARGLMK